MSEDRRDRAIRGTINGLAPTVAPSQAEIELARHLARIAASHDFKTGSATRDPKPRGTK